MARMVIVLEANENVDPLREDPHDLVYDLIDVYEEAGRHGSASYGPFEFVSAEWED